MTPGASELELISDPLKQLQRIKELSEKKDDPVAWSALANGYRVARLKRPLEAAIRQVGWSRVMALTETYLGEWPSGLREFLAGERRKEQARHRDGALSDAAWHRGEYGTTSD